jgi:hypothetical protein
MKCLFAFLLLLISSGASALDADSGNAQGAIWATHEAGYPVEARKLEREIRHVLVTAPLTEVIHQGGGVSTSYIAQFEGNIFAIVKEADPALPESYKHEVAAHLIDKLLGLHMAPLTVMREVNGKMYSVQLYYPGFPSDGFIDLMESEFFRRRGDVAAFDFLINNIDRNLWEGSNVLLGKEGRMIIFDHARSFFAGEPVTNLGALTEISAELREKILNTPESEFLKILEKLISPEGQKGFLERLRYLKTELNRLPSSKTTKSAVKKNQPKVSMDFEVPEKLQGHNFTNLLGIRNVGLCSGLF